MRKLYISIAKSLVRFVNNRISALQFENCYFKLRLFYLILDCNKSCCKWNFYYVKIDSLQ